MSNYCSTLRGFAFRRDTSSVGTRSSLRKRAYAIYRDFCRLKNDNFIGKKDDIF